MQGAKVMQDQRQGKLEQDAATACNYNHHHHQSGQDQHGCRWSAQCSNPCNLRKGRPFTLYMPLCIHCSEVLPSSLSQLTISPSTNTLRRTTTSSIISARTPSGELHRTAAGSFSVAHVLLHGYINCLFSNYLLCVQPACKPSRRERIKGEYDDICTTLLLWLL